VPGLNRNLVYMSAQVLPPRPLFDRFDAWAGSPVARVHRCNEESRTVAAVRDALLPKLISGELRIENAERVVGGLA
jgi:type I restriction enzyme, S subunit